MWVISLNAKSAIVEVYSAQADLLGEGPLWSVDDGRLYWLDIGRKRLLERGPSDAESRACALADHPGCLAALAPDSIAVAMGEGLHRLNLQSRLTELICAVPSRPAATRFNDGKVDPLGRFWASTMENNFGPMGELRAVKRHIGALYRFDTDGSVTTIEENVGIGNTLAWSPDCRHFYFADSVLEQIYIYDFDANSGTVHNKRIFFDASGPGIPDGSAIDVDGCLWNARWDGGAVLRITPDGKIDRQIDMPALRPTSCTFGGPDLDTLYVTSATVGMSPAQLAEFPLSGSVFAIHRLAQGMPVRPFRWHSSATISQ
jgi:sugar lactone lactonase YvrE